MKILAIETSCDETSAAVVVGDIESGVKILSNVIASSMKLHSLTGGIIPEVAARNQIEYIIPVIFEALKTAGISFDKENLPEIDRIALTYGPGLIGSLLVGVETVKTLSFIWNKPIIPVNHLFGHMYSNWILPSGEGLPVLPAIALIVSGGHTDLVLINSHKDVRWLGGTRDDAAGEAFDKIGRLLGLSYPAGPEIEKRAKLGNPKIFKFPRPIMYDKSYDFSFSGLKTSVLNEVKKIKKLDKNIINNLCFAVQDSIVDVLSYKTLLAAREHKVKSILLGGGVAANDTLKQKFQELIITKYQELDVKLFVPGKNYCTDNAAMIGAAAVYQSETKEWNKITANPELYFD